MSDFNLDDWDPDPEACKVLIDYLFSPEFEAELDALEPHTDAGDATSSSEARPNGGATAG